MNYVMGLFFCITQAIRQYLKNISKHILKTSPNIVPSCITNCDHSQNAHIYYNNKQQHTQLSILCDTSSCNSTMTCELCKIILSHVLECRDHSNNDIRAFNVKKKEKK